VTRTTSLFFDTRVGDDGISTALNKATTSGNPRCNHEDHELPAERFA
jgi:hypothetical protein